MCQILSVSNSMTVILIQLRASLMRSVPNSLGLAKQVNGGKKTSAKV